MKTWTSTCPSTAAATWTWSGCPAPKECWTTSVWWPVTQTRFPSPAKTWQRSWRSVCGSNGRWGERWAGSWTRSSQRQETSGTWRSDSVGGIQISEKAEIFHFVFLFLLVIRPSITVSNVAVDLFQHSRDHPQNDVQCLAAEAGLWCLLVYSR